MYPQTTPRREALGKRRQELMQLKEKVHREWLKRVAHLLTSFSQQYAQMRRESVLESFVSNFKVSEDLYKRQVAGIDDQLERINAEIERLAKMGY